MATAYILFDRAKQLAEERALHLVSSLVNVHKVPPLDASYLEADYCWMFFVSRHIVFPAETTIREAFVISKGGTRVGVNDYRGRPGKLYEALWGLSDRFGKNEFGVERHTVPVKPSKSLVLPEGQNLVWKTMTEADDVCQT